MVQTDVLEGVVRRSVEAAEALAALPAIATQDWCDRAAAILSEALDGAEIGVAIGQVGASNTLQRMEAVGVAAPSNHLGVIARRFAGGRGLGWEATGPWAARLAESNFPGWQTSDGGHHWSSIGRPEVLAGVVPVDIEASDDRVIFIEAGRPAGDAFTANDVALLRGLLPAVAHRVFKAFGPEPISAARMLTPREQEVLEHLTLGWSVKEIAEKLSRSPHTVHDYVKSLHRKLQASSRGGLIARALGHHGIEPGSRRDATRNGHANAV